MDNRNGRSSGGCLTMFAPHLEKFWLWAADPFRACRDAQDRENPVIHEPANMANVGFMFRDRPAARERLWSPPMQHEAEETSNDVGMKGATTESGRMAALRLAKILDETVASSRRASHQPRNALAIFLGGFAAMHETNGELLPLKVPVRIAKDLLRRKAGLACTTAVYSDVLECLWGNASQVARSLDGGWPLATEEAADLLHKTAFLIRAHAAAKDLGTP